MPQEGLSSCPLGPNRVRGVPLTNRIDITGPSLELAMSCSETALFLIQSTAFSLVERVF